MLVNVNAPVEVAVIFKTNKVLPVKIKWRERLYKIDKINMIHQVNDGRDLIHYFSVSDESTSFKLAFNTRSLIWTLEEVYHDD